MPLFFICVSIKGEILFTLDATNQVARAAWAPNRQVFRKPTPNVAIIRAAYKVNLEEIIV